MYRGTLGAAVALLTALVVTGAAAFDQARDPDWAASGSARAASAPNGTRPSRAAWPGRPRWAPPDTRYFKRTRE